MRDVAAEMGTSSGLIHHYFDSMDDVLAAAFERVARQDLAISARSMGEAGDPVEALRVFFQTYTPADKDWAFQLWLDAWAEAARRPAIQAHLAHGSTSSGSDCSSGPVRGRRRDRRRSGAADPAGAAWRILSLLDGLALQVVAHGTTISRADVVAGRRASRKPSWAWHPAPWRSVDPGAKVGTRPPIRVGTLRAIVPTRTSRVYRAARGGASGFCRTTIESLVSRIESRG